MTRILDQTVLPGRQSISLQHACTLLGCPTQGPPTQPDALLPDLGPDAATLQVGGHICQARSCLPAQAVLAGGIICCHCAVIGLSLKARLSDIHCHCCMYLRGFTVANGPHAACAESHVHRHRPLL